MVEVSAMKQPNYQYDTLADLDSRIMRRLHSGLPVCSRPYLRIAQALNMGEMALILRIQYLIREQRLERQRPGLRPVSDSSAKAAMSGWDKQLLALLRQGLPLSSRPFHIFAQQLQISVDEVLFRSNRLIESGHIRAIPPLI